MILQKAVDRMMATYQADKQSIAKMTATLLQAPGGPHTQTSATHTDPGNGPAKFANNAEKNANGGRVVAMLEDVLADTRKTEDQAMASEMDAQSAYENFMKDSNKSIKQTQESVSDMSGARAQAKEELSMAKTDFAQTMQELEGLDQTNQDLHKSCDYTLKNFDARQQARAAEMDALNEAKNILSGSK